MTPGGCQGQFEAVLCLKSENLKVAVDTSPKAKLNEWYSRNFQPARPRSHTQTHIFQRRGKTPGPWEKGKHICFECSFLQALLSHSVLPCEIHH